MPTPQSDSAKPTRNEKYRVVVSPDYTEYFDSKSKAERAIRVWFKKGRLEGRAGDKWLEIPTRATMEKSHV